MSPLTRPRREPVFREEQVPLLRNLRRWVKSDRLGHHANRFYEIQHTDHTCKENVGEKEPNRTMQKRITLTMHKCLLVLSSGKLEGKKWVGARTVHISRRQQFVLSLHLSDGCEAVVDLCHAGKERQRQAHKPWPERLVALLTQLILEAHGVLRAHPQQVQAVRACARTPAARLLCTYWM